MASGQQLAEENVRLFTAWAASKSDGDFRALASRGVLSRKEIAKECGFAKSALDQNPRIKTALRALEDALRERGVLPAAVPAESNGELPMRDSGRRRAPAEGERLQRLEQENAALRAEVTELKRQLARHAVLQEALALTGRVPR